MLRQRLLGFRLVGVGLNARLGFNRPTGKTLSLGSQYTSETPPGGFQYATRKVGRSSGRGWRWGVPPGGGHVGVPQPCLPLGEVGAVQQEVGGGGG